MLVLLPGLDGTGKLFAAFVRALGAGVESRVVGYSPDEPLGYEELELKVRAQLPLDRSYVLLGESFSGPIAMRIAARARECGARHRRRGGRSGAAAHRSHTCSRRS
jgi:pimeloyl-[acyl-carrier protein] methyl ester esterase